MVGSGPKKFEADQSSDLLNIRHNYQRKAAIAWGKATDHAGRVYIKPMEHFNLNKTIFSTLESKLSRALIQSKIAKDIFWDEKTSSDIEKDFQKVKKEVQIPKVKDELIQFLYDECDFSSEHADGSFLEHLLFCYEYSAVHFPEQPPLVMLLHSILGTGTNTWAMPKEKIPQLQKLVTEKEMLHIEAFPSFLRLLYLPDFLGTLLRNLPRLDKLKSVSFHRVIDNKSLTIDAENFWIQLNYQLIHYIDFLPAANWSFHFSDTFIQNFAELSRFLDKVNKRMAKVIFPIPSFNLNSVVQEDLSVESRLAVLIPGRLKKEAAVKSIKNFSKRIGHSLDFSFSWTS